MHIHEYQTKIILQHYGIPIPDFAIASHVAEAEAIIAKQGLTQAVVKVQVHAGGRGKAGGVKIAKSPQEILDATKELLGLKIINTQTGKEGIVAHQLLISPLVNLKKEYYLGAIIDRQNAQGMLIVSPEGGMEIEEVATKTPERIKTVPIRTNGIFRHYELIEIVKFMGWEGNSAEQGKKIIAGFVKAFVETDAMLLEINPLGLTAEGNLVALDAKLTVDDNALYRQAQIAKFYDATQLTPYEARAREHDLAYVALDGTIGCMVNGAGLAMATMDIIHFYGGQPANFLDVGGGATKEKIAEGFKIILSDHKVKAILVNIFGGIMNCATLAEGVVEASKQLHVCVPLVVRMEGTNVEKGKQILKDSGLDILTADDLTTAAKKVVAATIPNVIQKLDLG
jgi:succinyl-CoA synthetase beta subunit